MQTDARTLLNLPAKWRRRFQGPRYPEAEKKDYSGRFSTEFVGSTTRDGVFLSRTYSARLRAAACTTRGLCFVPVDIGFALHSRCIAPVCVSFHLASSPFRQLAPLSTFSCFSVFPHPSHTAHDFTASFPASPSDPRALSRFAVFPHRDETDWREGCATEGTEGNEI